MGKFDIKSSLNEVAGVVQPITTILSGATLVYNLLDGPRQKEAERKEVEERVDFIVNNRLESLVNERFDKLRKEATLTIRKETAEQICQFLTAVKVEENK